MKKERLTLTASGLGSYFGVGFNTPEEQLAIDKGEKEAIFDENAKLRMELGTQLENSVLDYFEKALKIIIKDRNIEKITGFDGQLRMMIDGMTTYRGEKTLVECKVSNSESSFLDNKGYYIQCQAYMEALNVNQCLLLGLHKGKPVFKLIQKNDSTVEDIKEVISKVVPILMGIEDDSNLPYDMIEKYSGKPKTTLASLDEDIKQYIEEIEELNKVVKEANARKKELTNYLKATYDNCKYKDNNYSVTIYELVRNTFDKDAFHMAYPDIDLSKYNKTSKSTVVKTKYKE